MKIPTCSTFVIFAPLWAATALLGAQTHGFTVEVQQVRDPDLADAIVLQVAMKNTSAKSVKLIVHDPFSDYSISIKDSLGRPVPLTDEGKRVYTPAPMPTVRRTIVVELAPNESTTSTIDLSQYFDIARPGKYKVEVSDKMEGVKPHATASTVINVSEPPA